jgi:hypothetical protein
MKAIRFVIISLVLSSCAYSQEVLVTPSSKDYLTSENNSIPSKKYYISKEKVTVKEWKEYLLDSDYNFEWSFFEDLGNITKIDDNFPITGLTFLEAIHYCNWLSIKKGLKPVYKISGKSLSYKSSYSEEDVLPLVTIDFDANGFRLPTVNEWRFAISDKFTLSLKGRKYLKFGWFHENTQSIQKNGCLEANKFGIKDFVGNTNDWLVNEQYLKGTMVNSLFVFASTGSFYSSVIEPPSIEVNGYLQHLKEVPNYLYSIDSYRILDRVAGIRLCRNGDSVVY